MKASAGRVLMLVENNYPQDPRVKNEADTLTAAGYQVNVIALRKRNQTWTETINGVRIFRVPRLELFEKVTENRWGRVGRAFMKFKAVLGYVCEYAYFTSVCFVASLYVFLRHGFDVIHAHNPPDTLFMVALPYLLIGKQYVFDHHDLCPELYDSRMGASNRLIYQGLRIAEACSLRLANMVVATNESYKQIDIARGNRKADTVFVVRNGPNENKMEIQAPSPRLRSLGKIIICYIGCLNPQDGVDYLLRSLHHLVTKIGRKDFYCVVMGAGDSLESLRELRVQLGLEEYLELPGFVSEADLLANLSAADICVDPDPSNPLNDQSTWIKIMEYMAYGKAIVSFDLKETRVSAQDAALFVEPNNEVGFAEAIATLMDDPERRRRMGEFGRKRVETELQWSVVGKNLVTAYASLNHKQ